MLQKPKEESFKRVGIGEIDSFVCVYEGILVVGIVQFCKDVEQSG